jgi:hypothetical protein
VIVTFVLAELYQFVAGAISSLQLGAPGVGDRASWIPNVLVGETYTILPIGFLLCLWGRPVALVLAGVCAAASLALALAATITLHPTGVPLDVPGSVVTFALLAIPGVVLMASVLRMRKAAATS